jgi:putative membrane protein
MSTLFAFLHHVAAFTLVSALAVEFVLIRQDLTLAIARRLPIVDAVLGISAGFLLVVGLLRVFFFEKGAAYYFHSHAFMTKFSVFIAVGLLSIIPTLEFLSWRKPVKPGEIPAVSARKLRFIRSVIHGELAAVVIILLCAAMMARGGWILLLQAGTVNPAFASIVGAVAIGEGIGLNLIVGLAAVAAGIWIATT